MVVTNSQNLCQLFYNLILLKLQWTHKHEKINKILIINRLNHKLDRSFIKAIDGTLNRNMIFLILINYMYIFLYQYVHFIIR